jgi:hypothetical protein
MSESMSETPAVPDPNLCKHGDPHLGDPHPCPYQCEINDDDDFECTCCEDCTQDCTDDI